MVIAVSDNIRELASFMENTRPLYKEKQKVRDEVCQLVETIVTRYKEEVGDIGEIDPITKARLEKEILMHISHDMYQEITID